MGIMGIDFTANEAAVADGAESYPSFMDVMVQQDLISTRSYSLNFDGIDSPTGTILFGGYDTSEYLGELALLPVQPGRTGAYTDLRVSWSGLTLTDDAGTYSLRDSASSPQPAILDSGSSLTYLPAALFEQLAAYFGAVDLWGNGVVYTLSLIHI